MLLSILKNEEVEDAMFLVTSICWFTTHFPAFRSLWWICTRWLYHVYQCFLLRGGNPSLGWWLKLRVVSCPNTTTPGRGSLCLFAAGKAVNWCGFWILPWLAVILQVFGSGLIYFINNIPIHTIACGRNAFHFGLQEHQGELVWEGYHCFRALWSEKGLDL